MPSQARRGDRDGHGDGGCELGPLLSVHRIDHRRHWTTGLTALGVAVAGGAALATLIAYPYESRTFGKALGLALIPTVVGLAVAAVQLAKAVRGGWGERVELYQEGLAHRSVWHGRRSWAYSDVTSLRVTAEPSARAAVSTGSVAPGHRPPRGQGWSLRCFLTSADGTRLRLSGVTNDAPVVVSVLRARCAQTPSPADDTAPDDMAGWRTMRWALPMVVLVCVGVLVAIGAYIRAHDSDYASSLSDSALAALAAVAIVFVVVLVLSLSLYILGLVMYRKQRR